MAQTERTAGMLTIDCLQYVKPDRARFEEWRAGGVSAVNATIAIWEDATETLREIGRWNGQFDENPDLVVGARSADDIRAAHDSGRTAVILGFQNTSPFEADLNLVPAFHAAGVRIAQLTYNTMNAVGSGCWEPAAFGMSRTYGKNLVEEMNSAGIMIDVSHCNEQTSFDAIETSSKPIAATHANPREFVGDQVELAMRNKSLDFFKAMAAAGGVVGLTMYPRLAPNGADCSLDDYCDMIEWTAERIGIEHIGFGSDYYFGHNDEEMLWWRTGRWAKTSAIPTGWVGFPDWFGTATGYPLVIERLRERGFGEDDLRAVAGENWLRIFDATWGSQDPGVRNDA